MTASTLHSVPSGRDFTEDREKFALLLTIREAAGKTKAQAQRLYDRLIAGTATRLVGWVKGLWASLVQRFPFIGRAVGSITAPSVIGLAATTTKGRAIIGAGVEIALKVSCTATTLAFRMVEKTLGLFGQRGKNAGAKVFEYHDRAWAYIYHGRLVAAGLINHYAPVDATWVRAARAFLSGLVVGRIVFSALGSGPIGWAVFLGIGIVLVGKKGRREMVDLAKDGYQMVFRPSVEEQMADIPPATMTDGPSVDGANGVPVVSDVVPANREQRRQQARDHKAAAAGKQHGR